MMQDRSRLVETTGLVIRGTVDIQIEAAKIISRFYLEDKPRDQHIGFIYDVLTNPLGSLSLVRDILMTILERRGIASSRIKSLDGDFFALIKVRNAFAHEMPITNTEKPGKFYLAKRKEAGWEKNMGGFDIEDKFQEFEELRQRIVPELAAVRGDLGMEDIRISTEPIEAS